MAEIEELLQEKIERIAQQRSAEEIDPNNPLVSVETQKKKVEHELSQYVQYAKRRCLEGFQHCVQAAKEHVQYDQEAFDANIKEAFSKFDDTAAVIEMTSQVASGICWKSLLGLTDQTVNILYNAAKVLFDKGYFPESEAAFYFLTTIDASQYAFWLGLGHAAFRLGNLNQAINAYETAAICHPEASQPHVYIANCFESMNDYDEAVRALSTALDLALQIEDKVLQDSLQERIRLLRQRR